MADNTARQLTTDIPDLEAYWMPFTGNRYFKKNPRMITRAEGMHCWTHDGRKLLDGSLDASHAIRSACEGMFTTASARLRQKASTKSRLSRMARYQRQDAPSNGIAM